MSDDRYILVVADNSEEMNTALEYACARSKKTGRKIIIATFIEPLDVLTTKGVTDIMKEELSKLKFKKGINPLISNITADEIFNSDEFKDLFDKWSDLGKKTEQEIIEIVTAKNRDLISPTAISETDTT